MGLGLLGVAVGSSAMSLGRARGNVVLGQPLSLAVEVRVDQADEATAQCFRVEVFHGDAQVEASRVRVLVQAPAPGAQDAVLRIRSSAVIDEPVVGVVLHALCGQATTRRYDFLPEFPAELQAAQQPVAVAAAALAPVPAPAPMATPAPVVPPQPAAEVPRVRAPSPAPAPRAAAVAPAPRPARPPAPAKAAAPKPAAPKPAAPKAAAPAVAKVQRPAPAKAAQAASAPAAAGAPRLTLDTPAAREAVMQPSPELKSQLIDDAAQRAAVAAIWRALRTTPEEIVRDRQRLEALESQQAAQSKQVAGPSAAERELRMRLERAEQRLDEAERGRVDILLVYGLLALLALVVALAAYFWHRARQAALAAAHWNTDAPAPVGHAAAAAVSVPPDVHSVPPTTFPRPVVPARASLAEEFLDSEPASALGIGQPSDVDTGAMAAAVFAQDRVLPVDASRPVRPDEFVDVQQHADFFVSLGQYEQAIEVLQQHLHEHEDMSPLAFLELFGIYHQLGRKDDFNALRTRFQRRFNAHVPNFAAFADEGLNLEDYPATLLSIETVWGHVRVLDTIEANLLRDPGDTGRPLDLAAYRDLLMLYGVAQDVFVPPGATRSPSGFGVVAASGFGAVLASAAGAGAAIAMPPAAAPDDAPLDLMLDLVPDSGQVPLPPLTDADGLELDIDLSTTNAEMPQTRGLALVDIDLPLLDDDEPTGGNPFASGPAPTPVTAPAAPAAAPGKPEIDSGLIDFDLFDPNTEARIAPKSTR